MSEQDIKQVSAVTGTFAVLKPTPERDQDGKVRPGPGNNMPEPRQADIEKLARDLNAAVQSIGRDLRFEVDLENGRSVIQVLDRETGEIIRQIPPEHAKTYVSDAGGVTLRLYDKQV